MECIDDIYGYDSCPSRRKMETQLGGIVWSITIPIIDDYLWAKHVKCT
jgi:hypothetical protein